MGTENLAEHGNSGGGATVAPMGGVPYGADSHQGELKGAQERAGEFPKRTLESTSKTRRKAAPGADESQGKQGSFRATLPSDRRPGRLHRGAVTGRRPPLGSTHAWGCSGGRGGGTLTWEACFPQPDLSPAPCQAA